MSRIAASLLAGCLTFSAYLSFSLEQRFEGAGEVSGIQPLAFHSQQKVTKSPPSEKRTVVVSESETGIRPMAPSGNSAARTEELFHEMEYLLRDLVTDYQSLELTSAQKTALSTILPEISQTAEGRQAIVSVFFNESSPNSAEAMYQMILDARLKDATLIRELITQHDAGFDATYLSRLIDLVADHTTVTQAHDQELENFLGRMAFHSDPSVSQAAAAQWIWYVNQHKGLLAVLDTYLLSHSPQRREEVYEIIETDAIQSVSERREIALALDSLEYAEYLSLDQQEKQRIRNLISRVSDPLSFH